MLLRAAVIASILGLASSASAAAATTTFSSVSASSFAGHTCAILSSGGVDCWGYNNDGQVGNGTTTNTYTPAAVKGIGGSGTLTSVTAIALGENQTCALLTSGAVDCWGFNGFGQLGNGSTSNSSTPVTVKGVGGTGTLTGVTAIASAGFTMCALLSSGGVDCWGSNENGQLGNGSSTSTNSSTPVTVKGVGGTGTLTGVTAITGGYHNCALLSSGDVDCWGYNDYGELGNGNTTNSSTPVAVEGVGGTGDLTGVTAISAGSYHTCALLSSGGVDCWGYNYYGQLGNGTTSSGATTTPVTVEGVNGTGNLGGVTAIGSGDYHTCALLSSGGVNCWGDNLDGQLGNNTTTNSSTPVTVDGVGASGALSGVSEIAPLQGHTCALLSSGGLDCWGQGNDGQLGTGGSSNSYTPVVVHAVLPDLFNVQGTITDGVAASYGPVTLTANGYTCTSSSPCSWSSSALPAGLTLTATSSNYGQTATLSGTPSAVQTAAAKLTVTQSSVSVTLSVTISDIENLSSGIGTFPTGMFSDSTDGKVYVAASQSNQIDEIAASANPVPAHSVSTLSGFGSTLNVPVGLDFAGGTLYASNFGSSSAAQLAYPFTGSATADSLSGCSEQEGIAADSGGSDVFVACFGRGSAGKVSVMSTSGSYLNSFTLASGASAPSGVAPNGTTGDVAVADAAANKLYTVNSSGVVGTAATLPTGAVPANVAYANVSSTSFDYVADPGTGQVSVINEATPSSPSDVADVSLPAGANADQPYGIATNGSSVLVVSDANNASAYVYTLSNASPYLTFDYTIALPSTAVPDGVADMTVSSTNLAFVGNESGNSVTIVDPPLRTDGQPATGTGTIGTPARHPIGTGTTPAQALSTGQLLAPPKIQKESRKHLKRKHTRRKHKRHKHRRTHHKHAGRRR